MKQLRPYRKFIIVIIIAQCIGVVLLGYTIFKARGVKAPADQAAQPPATVERPVTR
jgi:hypothetical protein